MGRIRLSPTPMPASDPQDEQVKIARSSALATWAGVFIATSGLIISVFTLFKGNKKPESPKPSPPQTARSAPAPAPAAQLTAQPAAPIPAVAPQRSSGAVTSKQISQAKARLRRRTKH